MKSLTAAILLCAPLCGLAQTPSSLQTMDTPKVSVTSRGNDVRLVLTNMFAQAKKSFILQSNVQFNLYLSLQETDFDSALKVICDEANLKVDIREGIYHIYQPAPAPAKIVKVDSPAKHDVTAVADHGRLPLSVLKRKITTHLAKAPIATVLDELGAQAGVKIEVAHNVPAYRLDAILNNTTLRFALEQVTKAARLTYSLTDHHSILVENRS